METDLYIRLVVAMVLGMLIGIERITAHKTAGVRTYTLVTMGSALFAIVSQLIYTLHPDASFNAAYIPAAVISGIGFLGTGLMIWKNEHLLGLTSAAGLWVCAGVGIACGYGFFKLATVMTILILFVFVVLWFIEQKIKKVAGYTENQNK